MKKFILYRLNKFIFYASVIIKRLVSKLNVLLLATDICVSLYNLILNAEKSQILTSDFTVIKSLSENSVNDIFLISILVNKYFLQVDDTLEKLNSMQEQLSMVTQVMVNIKQDVSNFAVTNHKRLEASGDASSNANHTQLHNGSVDSEIDPVDSTSNRRRVEHMAERKEAPSRRKEPVVASVKKKDTNATLERTVKRPTERPIVNSTGNAHDINGSSRSLTTDDGATSVRQGTSISNGSKTTDKVEVTAKGFKRKATDSRNDNRLMLLDIEDKEVPNTGKLLSHMNGDVEEHEETIDETVESQPALSAGTLSSSGVSQREQLQSTSETFQTVPEQYVEEVAQQEISSHVEPEQLQHTIREPIPVNIASRENDTEVIPEEKVPDASVSGERKETDRIEDPRYYKQN